MSNNTPDHDDYTVVVVEAKWKPNYIYRTEKTKGKPLREYKIRRAHKSYLKKLSLNKYYADDLTNPFRLTVEN